MKLYWRYKKDGKWTWKAARDLDEIPMGAKWIHHGPSPPTGEEE